ncbi:ATP-dependent DNA ligase [Sporolactobacillus shoreae]|uniref:ATP-dependent DNA ligase n=1 Tax=Sporolactobacillus shoreae TaxID=1465501 RepID=A0A4Z0GRG4_9BACL|nr:non-homologous end-joining DNA ligase [Sporolactobacillus shoreae]TGA99441.1 ATP-dependent DNA ligase [Sporolactobacillus shoreae]
MLNTVNSISKSQGTELTHPDKIIWEKPQINKFQYLSYLSRAAPRMLPFLTGRQLTVIRWPHGVPGASFFQKNCPDYAPDFIQTSEKDGTRYIVCNDLKTLLWMGNQLAIEYHIPFQKAGSVRPQEIVFDLDPAERADFPLAIKAAREMKQLFDRLMIRGYPKLSGSRGIQIHIPIHYLRLSYSDTRLFTSFVAGVLVEKFPDDFTTERLKKNRGGRLYIDYVQHAAGKTIICPYSPRGKEGATVAAPLFWEEVCDRLRMEDFSIPAVFERMSNGTDPMRDFFQQKNDSLTRIIRSLKRRLC